MTPPDGRARVVCQLWALDRPEGTQHAALCQVDARTGDPEHPGWAMPGGAPPSRSARHTGAALARWALQQALARLAPHGPATPGPVGVRPGVFGQPLLWAADGRPAPWGVSLSHRGAQACALLFPHEQPMGVDLEVVDPAHLPAFSLQWSAAESQHLNALPQPCQAEPATLWWAAREALGKALRCGLTVPAEWLAVVPTSGPWPAAGPGEAGVCRGHYAQVLQQAWTAWRQADTWTVVAHPARTRWRALGADPVHAGPR